MKFIVSILILSSAVLAQNPSATDIQADYRNAFNFYDTEATKFVENLASAFGARVSKYIAAHQNLLLHYSSIRNIPGVVLDANSEQILSRITSRIQNLIAKYPTVLNQNIFINELNKYMNILKDGPLKQAEGLITDLANHVAQYPAIGKCWPENRDKIMKIVHDGFIAARDAALTTVNNANITLNTNEILIGAQIIADNGFIGICRVLGLDRVNRCVATHLSISDFTFPIASAIWEGATNGTVLINLQIAETLIESAAQVAIIQVTQVVNEIQGCVKSG